MGTGCSIHNAVIQAHIVVKPIPQQQQPIAITEIEDGDVKKEKDQYKGFLSTTEFKNFKLKEVTFLTHNTKQFRFFLTSENVALDIPVGSHIQLRAVCGDGEQIIRNYTPISISTDKGFFDILVKRYEDGKVSKFIHNLKVGNTVELRGPTGRFRYAPKANHTICMICGGTGISPMLQIAKTVLSDAQDTTKIHLLTSDHSEEDIIHKGLLDTLASAHQPSRLVVHHFVSVAPKSEWVADKVGRINLTKIRQYMPPPSQGVQVLVCGSFLFGKSIKALLMEANFTAGMIFVF